MPPDQVWGVGWVQLLLNTWCFGLTLLLSPRARLGQGPWVQDGGENEPHPRTMRPAHTQGRQIRNTSSSPKALMVALSDGKVALYLQ